ncbi:alpha-amylase family glycosyl hydrolase [Phytohabitans flavus]|uniref:Alpha-amylase n=1 Tax=Phytohabitans flavus TaxID=1076124 RepID=A0A6F8XS22_9ACTN|nr:alpha-amylase family glycosyl hydrolase [Phytohabitans flavus]BCB76634.1 alpha-amylase [Phytohabitans flavus]
MTPQTEHRTLTRAARAGTAPWWEGAVIYHIYPRSFRDSDGDGVGDLAGLRAELPYLRWLGIDAIWLSPFYASPAVDFGYDVADHSAVDPAMGSLADFDAIVAEAHRAGIRVLVDFVGSNTSVRHPWFVESRSSRESPRRDWYIWADPGPGGGPPNNWISVFGGPAWTWDPQTAQYYLHSFLPEIPDLNWRNPAVETAMLDVLRFWMDRGVDGFRIDAAEHLLKDPLLRDNPPAAPVNDGHPKNLGEYDRLRHLYDRGHADIHPLYQRIRRLLDEHRPGAPHLAIAEIVPEPGVGLDHWASFYGAALDEIHMPMNLTLPALPWDAASFGQALAQVEAAIPPGGGPTVALGSHDEPRVASRYGSAQARCLLAVLLTLRGTAVLYYGDELGLPDSPVRPGEERDPWGRRNPAFNRDLGRTPMPWSAAGQAAGFTTAAEPWLPLPEGAHRLSVAAQRADPGSTLLLTRALLALRRRSPALRQGTYRPLELGADLLCYERRWGSDTVVVVANFAAGPREIRAPGRGPWTLAARTGAATQLRGDALSLGGYEAAVLRLSAGEAPRPDR